MQGPLLFLLSFCIYLTSLSALHATWVVMRSTIRPSHSKIRSSFRRRMIDPNLFYYNVDPSVIQQTNDAHNLSIGIMSMFNTFAYRLVGSLLGNLLAGAAVTFITLNLPRIFKINTSHSNDLSNISTRSSTSKTGSLSNKIIPAEGWLKLLLCLFIGRRCIFL